MFRAIVLAGLCLTLTGLPAIAQQNTDKETRTGIARDAMIVRIATGQSERKLSTTDKWVPLPIGADLASSDVIRTGKNSTILLELPEGSGFIRLLPETEVKVDELSIAKGFDGGQIAELSIVEGKVITKVRKFTRKSSRLRIHTKGATAAVRGTAFLTSFDKNQETKVLVGDGKVAVDAQGKQVMVKPKEYTKVAIGASPEQPDFIAEKLELQIQAMKPTNGSLYIGGVTDSNAEVNLNSVSVFPNNDGSFNGYYYMDEGNNDINIKASTIDGRKKLSKIKVFKFTD